MTRKFNTYTVRQNGLCSKILRYTISGGLFLSNEFRWDALLLCYVSWSHVLALERYNVLGGKKTLFKNQCCDKNTICSKNKFVGSKEDLISGER